MKKIVVVEDNPHIREIYALKLKRAGFDVKSAEEGRKGLKIIKEFRPKLVLLDLLMPVMDGVEMLTKLREEDWGSKIIVIVLTNVSLDEAPMELRLLDVKQYLVKAHYTPQQVVDIVNQNLERYNHQPNRA